MTNATPITSACHDEGPTALSPTEAAFLRMARSLDRCIAAERYLFKVSAPEFDKAKTACETAGEILATQIDALLAVVDADPALRRIAFLMKCVLSIEHNADRAYFASSLSDQASLFEPQQNLSADPRIRHFSRHCLANVARLVELRDTIVTPKNTLAAESPELAA